MPRHLLYVTIFLLSGYAQAESLNFTGTAISADGSILTVETDSGPIYLLFENAIATASDLSTLLSKTITGTCESRGDLCIVVDYAEVTEDTE